MQRAWHEWGACCLRRPQQIKTNVFLGRRTHFRISKQHFSVSGPCERREKQTPLNSRATQRRLFFPPTVCRRERLREATGQQHKTQQAACSQNALFALRVVIQELVGVSVAEMKQTLAQLYSYFDRPRNKTIIKSKLKNSRCRHLAQQQRRQRTCWGR